MLSTMLSTLYHDASEKTPFHLHIACIHRVDTAHVACSGLLHDTVEDTKDVTFEEIGQWFGPAVRRIVEGETRFSKISNISGVTSVADVKAEDLRQLFLAMTEEVRIIVVKLADRLHNMRTLGSMKPVKQKKIAAETLQVSCACWCAATGCKTLSSPDYKQPLCACTQPVTSRRQTCHCAAV